MRDMDRRLAAVWFADIVGFTTLADRDEDAALETVAEFQAVARKTVEGRGGRVVKFLGDGALAEFASARTALESALDLCGSFPPRGSRPPTSIRVGLHVGEVASAANGDLYGDGVNLAARIQSAAGPGEVVVSEDAARALRHTRGYRFHALGAQAIKGYPEPIPLFRVEKADSGDPHPASAAGPADAVSRPTAASERSIAVLPFANLSPDPGQDYFSDGVTEEILTSLARIEGLKVISRTSIMRYKGTRASLREIGRELGVESILEGSVRHAGSRVRITAQLVDAATDAHLWAERYDRDLEDILAIQTDVAERIVEALQGRLSPRDRTRLAPAAPADRKAYEETLRGRWFANRRTPEDLARAIEHFELAIAADPGHAPAHAGVATASVLLLHWERPGSRGVRDRAIAAAERAICLDPGAPEPWAARGMARIFDRAWAAAESDFRRAIDLGPGDAQARQWLAHLLACLGRFEEAIEEIDRALELDPLSLAVLTEAGNVRFLARRYDEALAYYDQVLDLDPAFQAARYKRFEAYLPMGRFEDAMRDAALLHLVEPQPGGTGAPGAPRRFLEALVEYARSDFWPLFHVATTKAALGQIDEAFADLAAARDEGDWYLVRAAVSPHCDPLRADPRFAEFLASIGLAGVPLPVEEHAR